MKIIYLITEYSYYLTHRKKLINFINKEKVFNEIYIFTNFDVPILKNEDSKINFININFRRSKISILNSIYVLFRLFYLIFKIKPTHIHCISMKTILFGFVFAAIYKKINFIFSINGLGLIYTKKKLFYQILKILFELNFILFLKKNNIKLIVQNKYEYEYFRKYKKNKLFLVKGSGVDLNKFNSLNRIQKKNHLRVIFVSRLIESKGIYDFLNIAKKAKQDKIKNIKFYIFGKLDNVNPDNININILKDYYKKGIISFYGYRQNINNYLNISDIAIFPTKLREGIPLSLIQSLASGLSVIAYNVPGCSDIIKNSNNGILVEKNNINDMYEKLLLLIKNENLRNKFKNNNENLISNYSIDKINSEILQIYL